MKTATANEIPIGPISVLASGDPLGDSPGRLSVGARGKEAEASAPQFAAARNTCKLCAPLGASLAFRGIENTVPLLHGSQGCATYIRRYMISHFREPVDIASSSFGEMAAIFGGKNNLLEAINNVVRQYRPGLIGIATTCLAETIGEDLNLCLNQIRAQADLELPELVPVSTAGYSGTHREGFWAAVRALVDTLAENGPPHNAVNVLPGPFSPADLRYLKKVMRDFGLETILLPDYSDTLDGPIWPEYQIIPSGGTKLADIKRTGSSRATIEFRIGGDGNSAGALLESRCGVKAYAMPPPIGIRLCDMFYNTLAEIGGHEMPGEYRNYRGRLIDCYVDSHKHVFGKRAAIYGEPELAVSLASMLAEVGIVTVLCATGSDGVRLAECLDFITQSADPQRIVLEGADFAGIEQALADLKPDVIIGNSKGCQIARKLGVPLVRLGFPIHDRIDGPRMLHLGYHGTQNLFDRVANALIGAAQDSSPIGYAYM